MSRQVCIDASFALMILLPDETSAPLETLWRDLVAEEADLVTAPLFFAEVTSVLRGKVYFGHIPAEKGDAAFSSFMGLHIRSVSPVDLQPHAWALAKKYNRPKAYDAQYLAVALSLGCELWTGDQRLVNAISAPWLKYVR